MRTLKQLAYLRPMCGRKRVFIVAEAEKMNAEAANSLLKVLEEPPLFSQILLVTSNPYLILPTIKSRCQVLNFSPVSRAEIEKVLRDRDYPEDRAKILSLLVRGNLDQALSLDWEEVQQERNDAWLLFLAFLKKDRTSSFLRRFAYQRRNLIREDFEQTLEFLAAFWRDFVLVKEDGDTRFVMNPDYAGEMESLLDLVSLEKSLEYADNIEDAISALNRNLNFSLVVSSLYSNFMG
jgi:DNA polymerase-3 subunit delta'